MRPDTSLKIALSRKNWQTRKIGIGCCYPIWTARMSNRSLTITSNTNPTTTYNHRKESNININGSHCKGNRSNGWKLNGAIHMTTRTHHHRGPIATGKSPFPANPALIIGNPPHTTTRERDAKGVQRLELIGNHHPESTKEYHRTIWTRGQERGREDDVTRSG